MSILTIVLFIIGVFILIGGAEILVRGASQLAIAVGVSPLVVGLTVVAFGTSSPELAVIVQAGLVGQADIAIGNVVGSNICNVLLVLGLAALVTPMIVSPQLLRLDVPLMIGVSLLLLAVGFDGHISRLDGFILFVILVVYTFWLVYSSRKENREAVLLTLRLKRRPQHLSASDTQHIVTHLAGIADIDPGLIHVIPVASDSEVLTLQLPRPAASTLVAEHERRNPALREIEVLDIVIPRMGRVVIHLEESFQTFDQNERESFVVVMAHVVKTTPDLIRVLPVKPDSTEAALEMPVEAVNRLAEMYKEKQPDLMKLRFKSIEISTLAWLVDLLMVIGGLGMLILGARWLVNGAVAFATMLGVSELIIGLTVVAVGTSLPEIATSVVAGIRGERDIVVGNVVGSNIFNILMVLGMGSVVSPIAVSSSALSFDIPVMIGVAVMCLPVFYTGKLVARWEGGLFLGFYVAYTLYLILTSRGSTLLPLFNNAMLLAVLPVTVLVLLITVVREVRGGSSHAQDTQG